MSTTDTRTQPEGRKRLVLAAVVLLLFLALVVAALQLFSGPGASPTTAPTAVSATSAPASPTPSPVPSAPAPPPALPTASAPTALIIESADINVPVLPLTPTEADLAAQSLVPPETLDGYWLTNYGAPGEGSKDTVYVTGHSWEGRESPFNRLSSDVEVGDSVTLTTAEGEIDYVVDTITTHNKDTLKDSDIWDIVPNRLVLISCYTEDLWGKNVIVTATPIS
ncbi:Sortase (surface protein transpeptidase) [Arthrobacter subterraneus]|uniref:Sortase (Surface protein transpeptidase) n=1 Tax=Arthrobacter subterraneus TaxID=335973 RepID=A0A1G8K570_9MICC|nr:class F sortase [Arthrobacter subterraneus]SDI38537.1 Sortase (surface protein transpeptidase) [Arthrobacter subterraneus]